MTTKYTKEEINEVLNEFGEVTYEHWGSYAYSAGALQMQLSTLLADMPRYKQAEVLSNLKALTEKYSKQKETV